MSISQHLLWRPNPRGSFFFLFFLFFFFLPLYGVCRDRIPLLCVPSLSTLALSCVPGLVCHASARLTWYVVRIWPGLSHAPCLVCRVGMAFSVATQHSTTLWQQCASIVRTQPSCNAMPCPTVAASNSLSQRKLS